MFKYDFSLILLHFHNFKKKGTFMNFIEIYQNSCTTKKASSLDPDPFLLIPNIYSYGNVPLTENEQAGFLHVSAGGRIQFKTPFSFSFRPFASCMLLYTESGTGSLTFGGSSVSLESGHVLFFDCSQHFCIHHSEKDWAMKLFFLSGTPLSFFRSRLHAKDAPCFLLPDYSPVHKYMIQLLGIRTDMNLPQFLLMQQMLNDILTAIFLSEYQTAEDRLTDIPSYILEMKDFFDHHYQEDFSLDECQERYKISKYRLCREFSKHFHTPPLHYRNQKRLEAAKEMLLTTELNIHEISSMVGFENVNHFINLFKQYTNYTPNAFKQKALAGQSALHSHAQ